MERWVRSGVILLLFLTACDKLPFGEDPVVYVTASALNLRDAPSTDGKVLDRLERGEQLEVEERQETWMKVENLEGMHGWVHGDYVGSVEEARAAYEEDLNAQKRAVRRRLRSSDRTRGENGDGRDDRRMVLTAERLLNGVEPELELQELEAFDGESRFRGVSPDHHIVVEFVGELDRVKRATMMVSVEDLDDEELNRNAALALRFVKNAIPNWKRDTAWLADRLKAMSRVDVGRGEIPAGDVRVTLDYVKPLGSVRFTIEPTG